MPISIDQIVTVTRTTVGANFQQAALIENFLTENILVPADNNRVKQFFSLANVGAYFGTTSDEYAVAQNYFYGYDNSRTKPQSILFSRYVQTATAAYMFGSPIISPTATVTAIKALSSPVMTTHINGVTQTLTLAQSDFASATGLTDIAAVIETALDAELAACTVSVIGTNQFMIEAPSSGASTSLIGYCTGNVTELMLLNADDFPTLSQGTTGGNAAFNMGLILNATSNWMALSYVKRLTGDVIGSGYPVTVDLSSWIGLQNGNYVGLWWEGGAAPTNANATNYLSTILVEAGYGTSTNGQITFNIPIQVDYNGLSTINTVTTNEIGRYAAFVGGIGASINYSLANSKINFAAKAQSILPVNVTNDTDYKILLLRGYNVYGQFASRTTTYNFTENGSMGGTLLWIDNYYDAVWLSDQLQNQVATLIKNSNRIPYNSDGVASLVAVLNGVAQAGLTNNVIEPGNTFTPDQIIQITNLVGEDVSPLLTQNGFYIYATPITAQQRIGRLQYQLYMLYTNGGAINQVAIGQVFVQ